MVFRAFTLLLAGVSVVCALDMSQCIAPLGMESGLIPDKDITASSCYNDGNVAPQNGRLNQEIKGGAWCPRSQITTDSMEWLEVDLRAVHVVTGVGTQGRFGNGLGQEFAENYIIEYWRPRLGKWVRYRTQDGQQILPGNKNTYLEQKNHLSPALWASKMRFIPYSSHRRTVCMRVEIYGCLWTAGIVSYSMPAGNARSNGVELSDLTYDGVWSGGELRGGLGQLVDGTFGGDEIREAARASAWVGWRNDSHAHPPAIIFEFDRVREFRAVHIYCNNRFMRDVRVFAEAIVSFSVGGRRYQEEKVRLAPPADSIFETSRNVTIKLHHRIGRWVRIELRFAARWILVSEVTFESDAAQGNHSVESVRSPSTSPSPPPPPVATAQAGDPLYVAVVVGVLTTLGVLLAVAALLIVHRHRHRKCFASPLAKTTGSEHERTLDNYSCSASAAATLSANKAAPPPPPPDLKFDDYQEPYQAMKCSPYFTCNMALEMNSFPKESTVTLSDSSNYEYAVPETSLVPLLAERRPRLETPRTDYGTLASKRSAISVCRDQVMDEVRRRLAEGVDSIPEFPPHRLRMISKLAEGAFGTVYVAETDGMPEYESGVRADKQLVAVKFLAQDATQDERCEFEKDVLLLAALSHPCLARVVGACRAPLTPLAVVLEYLEGGDLCSYLRTACPAPPLPALLHLIAQIAAGMRYLEALNFVHRDLAARNCLVGPGYQLKISDFGTDNEAYARDYWRVSGRPPLPLRWASWEAALAGKHSTAADVWAFGVTLYEIFTFCRRTPYEHMTDEEVLENLTHLEAGDGVFVRLERAALCPRDVYEVMRACWRREPQARITFREAHAFFEARAPVTKT